MMMTMTHLSNSEEFAYQLVSAERQLEEAHNALDLLGIPRKSGDWTLTVFGRIDWFREWFPKEWARLANAVNEVRYG